jgi:hypothetical protein
MTTVATAMAGGTDNNQLKLAAKTRWRWQQRWKQQPWAQQQLPRAHQRLPWALAQMESPSPPPVRVVGAGCDGCVWGCGCWLCVCSVPLLFCVLLEAHVQKCTKNLANHGILGISGKLVMRRAKLLHLIKANL